MGIQLQSLSLTPCVSYRSSRISLRSFTTTSPMETSQEAPKDAVTQEGLSTAFGHEAPERQIVLDVQRQDTLTQRASVIDLGDPIAEARTMRNPNRCFCNVVIGVSAILLAVLTILFYLRHQAAREEMAQKSARTDPDNPARTECLELLGFSPDTGDSQYFEKTLAKHKVKGPNGLNWTTILEHTKKLFASGKKLPEVKESLCSENNAVQRRLLFA